MNYITSISLNTLVLLIVSFRAQGKLSDTWGRKQLLVLAYVGPFFGYVIIGLTNSLVLFVLSRIIHGKLNA